LHSLSSFYSPKGSMPFANAALKNCTIFGGIMGF
jgi:hypothetical protein